MPSKIRRFCSSNNLQLKNTALRLLRKLNRDVFFRPTLNFRHFNREFHKFLSLNL